MRWRPFPLLSVLTLAAACSAAKDEEETDLWPEDTSEAVATHARIVEATYADAITAAQDLDAAVAAFLAAPSPSTLADARDAWRAAREPYLQSEVFRFQDGPIDDADGPEGLLNAWPLDEHLIDYVEGDPDAGIVNDPGVTLDAATLIGLNEDGGDANITVGYHAIEFLLWGQDHDPDGPGDRPFGDYVDAPNADRRGDYLGLASGLVVEHLTGVHAAWTPTGDYRVGFEAEPELAVERILTGMIVLSGFETGGERIQASLDSGSQEDEHSCFSDNTHRDMIGDVLGIENVWYGRYRRLDGTTIEGTALRAIVEQVDAGLAAELDDRIATSLAAAEAIRPPYDQEIALGNAEGRARVQALALALRDQEDTLFELFDALGLSVTIPE